jgi:hypothetical protein
MTVPKLPLSTIGSISGYAGGKEARLIISSVLFDGHTVEFPAFLTDMANNFTSTWNTENVFGRNDPIGIFQGTVRVINLGFTVVGPTQKEAINNLKKLDILASFLYPSYKLNPGTAYATDSAISSDTISTATSHMHGSPLVRVKFGSLIDNNLGDNGASGLLGWIGGLSMAPNMEAGVFHSGGGHYPKIWDISFDLNVLHEKTPGYNQVGGWLGNDYFFGAAEPATIDIPAELAEIKDKLASYGSAATKVLDRAGTAIEDRISSATDTIKGFLGSGDE